MGLASRLGCALALSAVLAAPASAQIPGAHYTGTTGENYPFSFDVAADGNSLTNVVTSYFPFCMNAASQITSTNSQYAFPIAGGTISGTDTTGFPRLLMRGTFTSAQEASGNFDASSAAGVNAFCNELQQPWRAKTSASAPGGNPGGNAGGGDPVGGNPGDAAAGKPVVTVLFPKGVLLKPSLSNGFVVGITLDQPAGLSGKVILSAKDAKKYGLGKKAITIAKASAALGSTDSSLEFKVSKAAAKKLKKAKKLKLQLEVTATNAAGLKGTGSQALSFK